MKKLFLTLLIIFITSSLFSQWELIVPHNEAFPYLFHDVLFLNKDTGFIVGGKFDLPGEGVILKTINGGISWDTTYTATNICSIVFIDNQIGFAGSGHTHFYKTNNGGQIWEEISFSNSNYFYNYRNNSIHFVDSLVGYISSTISPSVVHKTTNGGLSWNMITSPLIGYSIAGGSIYFASQDVIYVGLAYKSYDSGANWIYMLDTISPTPNVNFRVGNSNNFLTETFGMVAGNYMTNTSTPCNRGMIGITHDGGYNYVYKEFNGLYDIHDILIIDDSTAYAVGELSPPTPQDHSPFLATIDGGNTWGYQEYEQDSYFIYPVMHAMCFINDKVGYAVSYYGQIYKTTNSGGELIPITTQNEISEIELNNDILLFPNPANDLINIRCDNLKIKDFSLIIYNSSGQIVKNGGYYFYKNNYLQVDISNLSSGIYFVEITGGAHEKISKFIKN